METVYRFLEFELFHYKDNSLIVLDIITVVAIFLGAKFVLWLIKKALHSKSKFSKLSSGNSYALLQIINYLVWITAIGLMLQSIGVKLTFLLTSSAALLVGIGLGLQQTFNDVLSGIILLFDTSLNVGDILDVDGDVVIMKEIGFRTSKGLNRNQILVTLPNSFLTTNKVINWSNQSKETLFNIDVGVAYGSDVDLVMKILKESAAEHPDVLSKNVIESRFVNFGDSSLDFSLLFYSKNLFRIERVKSEIRVIINRKFNEHNISIPFPQMDLHIKSRLDKEAL